MTCSNKCLILVLLIPILASCKTGLANPFAPLEAVGNERTVSIIGNVSVWHTYEEILSLADSHCAKYGRIARRTGSGSLRFDCVE